MKRRISIWTLFLFSICNYAQNDCKIWYFGGKAGLNFDTNPPTILTNSAMDATEGCGSISDDLGYLLFYSKGDTVWNKQHLMMANGFGIGGNNDATQAALILKQPGNSGKYFIFLQSGTVPNVLSDCRYAVVDMNLAAGNGSVITKNQLLHSNSTEKLCAVKHCNNVDIWVISHEANTNIFRSFLLTSAGVSTLGVTSAVGSLSVVPQGAMKVSHKGRKLGMVSSSSLIEVFDFDNSTGLVSNPLTLRNIPGGYYGCEFSPDDSKFYVSSTVLPSTNTILQWNLCAGSNPSILASQYTIVASPGFNSNLSAMQLAPNGKIYVARPFQSTLAVIHNPNASGATCNFVELGQSIFPKICRGGLPDFVSSSVKENLSYSISACLTASFSAPSLANPNLASCAASSASFTGINWSFGDPNSGTANTSTLIAPTHSFSGYGTYTVTVVLNYANCGSDTIKQTISLNSPTVSLSTASLGCNSLATATVFVSGGSGNYSYTWSPSAQSNSIGTALAPGNYTIAILDNALNCTFNYTTSISTPSNSIGFSVQSTPLCNYANATVNVVGGSANNTYLWNPGGITTATANNLISGTYTVTVNDVTYGCNISHTVQINVLPLPNVTVSPNATVCARQSITLQVGGADVYIWNTGSNSSNIVVTPTTTSYYSATGTFTSGNCSSSKTITITVVPCLALFSIGSVEPEFYVYPNPSNGVFQLQLSSEVNITLQNSLGQTLTETTLPKGLHLLDLTAFENGMYLLKVENLSGGVSLVKLFKATP